MEMGSGEICYPPAPAPVQMNQKAKEGAGPCLHAAWLTTRTPLLILGFYVY